MSMELKFREITWLTYTLDFFTLNCRGNQPFIIIFIIIIIIIIIIMTEHI